MKHKTIKKAGDVFACFAIAVCIALMLPQIRELLINAIGAVFGKNLDPDRWNNRITTAALSFLLFFIVYLLLFSFKITVVQMRIEKEQQAFSVAQIVLICLYSCMLVFLAFSNDSVWMDEAYTLDTIRHSWEELFRLLVIDTNPPFYFFTLKASSLVFGDSVAAMRMVSVFPVILMAIFVCIFLKREFSEKAALVFLLSLITSESIAQYAIEIRMYSWALFFVTMMAVSAWYFFKTGKKRWWAALLFSALGAAYTHNYAMFAAVIGYLLLLLYTLKFRKEKIAAMAVLAVSGILLFLPWLPILAEQSSRVSESFWIAPLNPATVLGYVYTLFSVGNYFLTMFLYFMFVGVLILFFARKGKTEKDFFIFGCLCCAVLLALTGIIMSVAIRPLLIARYLIPVCALIWLFFSVECSKITSKRAFALILVILTSMGLVSFTKYAHSGREEQRASNVFYSFITTNKQQNDIFVFVFIDGKGSSHVPLLMSHLFPNQMFTATSDIGENFDIFENEGILLAYELWSESYTEYTPALYNNNTVWTFISGFDEDAPENDPQSELWGEFIGFFQWSHYKFMLYRSSPDPAETANSN